MPREIPINTSSIVFVHDPYYKALRPTFFRTVDGRTFRVRENWGGEEPKHERWSEIGLWWNLEKERYIWRLHLANFGCVEVAEYQTNPRTWSVTHIWD